MACFEDVETEDLNACVGVETQAGVSEVELYYTPFEDVLNFPMPKNIGDAGYDYESSVEVTENITFNAGKGWAKIVIQSDTGEGTLDLVGNKGNKKEKNAVGFYIGGNDKKALGYVRTNKNRPSLYMYMERNGQRRIVGDKFNPAYMNEVKATTGKGGEDDKGIQVMIESYGVPIVYSGTIQRPPAPDPIP